MAAICRAAEETERGKRLRALFEPCRPAGCRTVLDLGCGDGFKAAAYHGGLTVIGVEIAIEKARQAAQLLPICLRMDMRAVPDIFPESAVDWITMVDALEHLPWSAGYDLLLRLREIARAAITVFAPEGDATSWRGVREGYDRHESAWQMEDFQRAGFAVKRLAHYHGRERHALLAHWTRPSASEWRG
jgi:trans-aconitate methyltransferase